MLSSFKKCKLCDNEQEGKIIFKSLSWEIKSNGSSGGSIKLIFDWWVCWEVLTNEKLGVDEDDTGSNDCVLEFWLLFWLKTKLFSSAEETGSGGLSSNRESSWKLHLKYKLQ